MSAKSEICPFKVGDYVVYKPSERGWGYDDSGLLVPGRTYVVGEIKKERYVAVEGYDHPGGGLYWTEFEAAKSMPASTGAISDTCPFKVGDRVVYKPSEKGWGYELLGRRLVPGRAYVVNAIQDERYVLLEGDAPAGGGLSWTEFEAAKSVPASTSTPSDICPFKVGDHVVYKPSEKGWDYERRDWRVVPGRAYVVKAIQDERYVIVGDDHPAGGLSWTEFEAAK
jgi:hypothetical protein